MHFIKIPLVSIFIVLPIVASAQLPVVNISSGAVSARAAFGEDIVENKKNTIAKNVASNKTSTRTKKVVARAAMPQVKNKKQPSGGEFIATNDVLIPQKPSADLWAKNDYALRMPMPSEFSVIRSDNLLPEESLDKKIATASERKSIQPKKTSAMSEMDSQIAKLIEMQKQAENTTRTVSERVIAAPIAEEKIQPVKIARTEPQPQKTEEISVRRMVVPMETNDVIVRSVEKNISPRITAVRDDMTKMTPVELRNAFRKTFLSENKHLSTYSVGSQFDVASDMSSSIEGFTAQRGLSEGTGIRPLEVKIKFRNDDSALSRDNYTLLTEFAGIVVNKPTSAIQIAIPQYMTQDSDNRKLAARRLAIVEQALTDNGVSQQRVIPVLSTRENPDFVLRIISIEEYETLTQQKRDIFGDSISKKTYKSMSW